MTKRIYIVGSGSVEKNLSSFIDNFDPHSVYVSKQDALNQFDYNNDEFILEVDLVCVLTDKIEDEEAPLLEVKFDK